MKEIEESFVKRLEKKSKDDMLKLLRLRDGMTKMSKSLSFLKVSLAGSMKKDKMRFSKELFATIEQAI